MGPRYNIGIYRRDGSATLVGCVADMEAAFRPTVNVWRTVTLIILAYILDVAAQVSQVDCAESFAWVRDICRSNFWGAEY